MKQYRSIMRYYTRYRVLLNSRFSNFSCNGDFDSYTKLSSILPDSAKFFIIT
eukprot:UN03709